MALLIHILLVSFSVTYISEAIAFLFRRLVSGATLTNLLIPPLALLGLWLLDTTGIYLVLSTLAASFISTVIATAIRALSAPKVIARSTNRYY